ncbi:MAG: septum formation initiator family protein [Bacillota bacterium]|nr:septum formation initiator family protein [Bacillota bacterium]
MKKKKTNIKTLLFLALIVYLAGTFIRQEFTAFRLNKEIDKANIQLQAVKEKGEQLKEQLEMSKTNPDGFSEKQARERLGYIKKDETPVMPLPERQ